jgi:hypothetical protein
MEKRGFACVGRFAIAVAAAMGLAAIGCESSGDVALDSAKVDAGAHRGGDGLPTRVGGGDALGAGTVLPKGTQLVQSTNIQIDGVTTDGYAAYTDVADGTLYVVSLAGGEPLAIGIVDQFNEVFVKGKVVVFAPAATNLGVADLSVWSAANPKTVPLSGSAAAFNSLVAVSDDGNFIMFFDDVDPDAIGNLVVARVDGSARTRLVTGVQLSNGDCTATLAFAGGYAIAGYCTQPPSTTKTLHAGVSDGGPYDPVTPAEGGADDGGAPATSDLGSLSAVVSTFSGPNWSQRTIATGVQSQFTVDAKGTELMVAGAEGLLWFPLDGESGGTTIDVAGTHGDFVSDGGAILYTTSANDLARSSVTSPSPMRLTSGIAHVIATSPDENWVVGFLGLDLDTYTVDLYYASATMSGPASPLVPTLAGTTGGAYGDSFTADSSYAIFFTDIGEETATLYVAPLGANAEAPSLIAPNVYAAYAMTGSKVLFNDDYDPDTSRADIVWVDAAHPTATTTLVSEADAPFYMTPSKSQIVYSWNVGTGPSSGLWIMRTP